MHRDWSFPRGLTSFTRFTEFTSFHAVYNASLPLQHPANEEVDYRGRVGRVAPRIRLLSLLRGSAEAAHHSRSHLHTYAVERIGLFRTGSPFTLLRYRNKRACQQTNVLPVLFSKVIDAVLTPFGVAHTQPNPAKYVVFGLSLLT
jgi:hypothetical protein